MIHFKYEFEGPRWGCRYIFKNRFDKIPTHSHPPHLEHNITVVRGSVLTNNVILKKGDIYEFDGTKPHSIMALCPDTEILNVYKHGIPPGYLQVPKEQLEGTVDE